MNAAHSWFICCPFCPIALRPPVPVVLATTPRLSPPTPLPPFPLSHPLNVNLFMLQPPAVRGLARGLACRVIQSVIDGVRGVCNLQCTS